MPEADPTVAERQHVGTDRWVIAVVVVATCALFTARSLDPVNVIKLVALLVGATALVVLAVARIARDRVLVVPTGLAPVAAAVLALAFLVAALVAPVATTAVLGTYGRNSGLLAYAAALLLFAIGARAFAGRDGGVLVVGVTVAGLFTATYGLLQRSGRDAIPWNNPFNPIIAGLGNPNFTSGYLGIAAAVAAGGALWAGWRVWWRVGCGVTAVLCLLTAFLTSSVQGPIAAAGGLFVVVLARSLDLPGRARGVVLAVLGGGAVLAVGALLLGGVAKAGPAASIFEDVGSQARLFYWGAALRMFRDRPLVGQGLDQYGNFWRTARSAESVPPLGGGGYSDAAHSVPLQMLAQGGLVLGLAYAAFVLLVGVALVRGLLRLSGERRMLLGALGGGWAAYQVQSFVSIDQVPLLVLHFALAGGVVAVSGTARLKVVGLPGALKPVKPTGAKGRRKAASRLVTPRRSFTGPDLGVVGLAAVLGLVAAWFSLYPLRANIAAKSAGDQQAAGNTVVAMDEYAQAKALVPGQTYYEILAGQADQDAGDIDGALASYEAAIARDPYEVNATRVAAQLAEQQGDLDRARELYRTLVRLDPYNEASIVPAATFELRHSGGAEALRVLEDAAVRIAGSASVWATLGDARAVTGDPAGAREAYDRALTLEPGQPVATEGLAKLGQA